MEVVGRIQFLAIVGPSACFPARHLGVVLSSGSHFLVLVCGPSTCKDVSNPSGASELSDVPLPPADENSAFKGLV